MTELERDEFLATLARVVVYHVQRSHGFIDRDLREAINDLLTELEKFPIVVAEDEGEEKR